MIKDAFFARPLVPEVQQKAEFWRQIERLASDIRRRRYLDWGIPGLTKKESDDFMAALGEDEGI